MKYHFFICVFVRFRHFMLVVPLGEGGAGSSKLSRCLRRSLAYRRSCVAASVSRHVHRIAGARAKVGVVVLYMF